jgi:hypothetical protein
MLCRKLIRPITVVAALTMAGGVHAAESMVFATLRLRAGGLAIGGDIFFNSRSEQLAALTLRHAVPTIYQIPYRGLKT